MEKLSGHARCPKCGFEFRPWMIMQVNDIASMFGVKMATVNDWMSRRGLPYRLWRTGRYKVLRVVLSSDLQHWLDTKLGTTGDESPVSKLHAWRMERGRMGAAARARNKALRAASEASTPTD